MRVIAIDPHIKKPYAFALFEDGKLVSSGSSTLAEIHREINKEVDLVIIETQYLQMNFKVAADLACSKGKVLGWCETHDIPFVEVYPVQWQSNVGYTKKRGESKDMVSEKQTKIRKTIERQYGIDQRDQQDCILMYHWWRDRIADGEV